MELSLPEYSAIVRQMQAQPPWRAQADRCADYADGNQLDAQVLARQRELGIAPAKEDIIGPVIRSVCGYEAKTRTDWRVSADTAQAAADNESEDIAAALNFELNQAERHSGADRALGQAFRSMLVAGIGWVEVTRSPSSLQYPYQCRAVHRNEIFWDMTAHDMQEARWLVRRRWVDAERALHLFPQAREILSQHGVLVHSDYLGLGHNGGLEGGVSTALHNAPDAARAWTQAEEHYYNTEARQVCLSEVWYRRWVKVEVLVSGAGLSRQAVAYEADNAAHQQLLASGQAQLKSETQSRIRRAWWLGPHCLHDGPSPYAHGKYPYIPLFGWREDMTGIPYGLVRGMVFPQDSLNHANARLVWGLTSVQVIRTQGAALMTDEQLRRTIAMTNADIVLDDAAMAQNGARFEIKRDFPLNAQHFQLMQDARAAIRSVSGVTNAFDGSGGSATSGLQEQTQLEQSQTALAELFDNFKAARSEAGELLLAMIIEDLGEAEHTVTIAGNVFTPARRVVLNQQETDPITGMMRRRMNVRAQRLRVALEDVPTSSSFRSQQMASLTEAIKSAPSTVQQALMPYLFDLMPIPNKKEVTELLRQAGSQPDPESIKAQAMQEAKAQLQYDLKERELALKAQQITQQGAESEARIGKLVQEAVQTGVQAAYAATQAAYQIVQNPQVAAIGDTVLQTAGYQKPQPVGDDPDLGVGQAAPILGHAAPDMQQAMQVRQNTSPAFPPLPQQADSGLQGIETMAAGDNLPHPPV